MQGLPDLKSNQEDKAYDDINTEFKKALGEY
jgi:hypothetical protein